VGVTQGAYNDSGRVYIDPVLEPGLRQVGLHIHDFQMMGRSRGRTAYRAPRLGIFARTDAIERAERASHEVQFAMWAAERSLPTVETHPRFADQPVSTPHGSLTLWRLGATVPPAQRDYEWLGDALRRFHDAETTSVPCSWPVFRWLAQGLEVVERNVSLDREAAQVMASEVERITNWMLRRGSQLPVAVIHGDGSFGNVISIDDRLTLTDFETSGVGPAAYDLAAVRVRVKRFGLSSVCADRLTVASGIHAECQDQAMLDRLYELVGIAAVLAPHLSNPLIRRELETRIRTLDQDGVIWTPHRRLLEQPERGGEATRAGSRPVRVPAAWAEDDGL
jgi:aminoglycoside phosphotransferase